MIYIATGKNRITSYNVCYTKLLRTSFMLSIAKNAARVAKKHIAIFSMEMSNEQLVQRLISQETGIDAQRLRLGKLKGDEWNLFAEAVESLGRTHIFLDDTPGITPTQMRAKCRRLHSYNFV